MQVFPITIITGANSATIAMWSVTRAHKLHQIEFKPAGANLYCTPVKFAVLAVCSIKRLREGLRDKVGGQDMAVEKYGNSLHSWTDSV